MMKLLSAAVVLTSVGVGATIVYTGRSSLPGSRAPILKVASPTDTFIVHDAPPADPATPLVGDPSLAPPADSAPDASLSATIDRLRAAAANPGLFLGRLLYRWPCRLPIRP